jgi:hypothetical protein
MWTLVTSCAPLGYNPKYLTPDQFTADASLLTPSYADVKRLGYEQAGGYFNSARVNRDTLWAGAAVAGVSAAAMALLGFFNPATMAMQIIPAAGGLAGGGLALAQNDAKVPIYLNAGFLTLLVLEQSDQRLIWSKIGPENEALCLRADLRTIDARVQFHLMALNPQHVVDQLKAVGRTGNLDQFQTVVNSLDNLDDLKSLDPLCGKAILPPLPTSPSNGLPPPR